jgi:uncharacterized membrane protein YcaP (DUF421 family)
MDTSDFFSGWHPLLRTLVLGVSAYGALILMLRLSGKRTLAAMNAFDLVVTFAIGSTLASILVSQNVALAQGLLALALLLILQFIVSLASIHSTQVQKTSRSEPRMLCYQGKVLPEALRKERMTEGELLQALREHGYAGPEAVLAAVLETNGKVSVIGSPRDGPDHVAPGRIERG